MLGTKRVKQKSPPKGMVDGAVDGATGLAKWLDQAWQKVNRATEINYELACRLAHAGRVKDAILRFRITLWFAPNHEMSLYNLACLYHHQGEGARAIQLLMQILKANPKHPLALYKVATINPGLLKPEMRPHFVPPAIIYEASEAQAPFYNEQMRLQGYRLPMLVHELLRAELASDFRAHDMLDLGCGTGLSAMPFRAEYANIIGVDVSPAMLNEAAKRYDNRGVRIYSRLVQEDVRRFVSQPAAKPYDSVLALSLFPFVGDVSNLLAGVYRQLRPGGLLVFSYDAYSGNEAYSVLPRTGYFGHSIQLMNDVAQSLGYEVLRQGPVQAAAQQTTELCFLRKPAASSDA